INCTDCGPRFTIIKNIPYDRERTTMDKFTMCSECSKEYNSPASRRFHAQPNACPHCGPQVSLIHLRCKPVGVRFIEPAQNQKENSCASRLVKREGTNAVKDTIRLLKEGDIVAIKGLGGFHLACDATNDTAVRNLRKRKNRENKPFALMAKNLEVIKQFCEVSPEEEQLLLSAKSPIVLLKKRAKELSTVSEDIAPNNKYLGFILPYTPLHHLLFHATVDLPPSLIPEPISLLTSKKSLSVLVMTSGNFSDEPIIYKNDDASAKLKETADFLLVHNRDIFIQCDDSVTRVFPCTGDEIIIRRARGYVPEPVRLRGFDLPEGTAVLATGADLKNTFCLARGNQFIVSQHIGDMENFETFSAFENSIEHFEKLFKIIPTVVACDLHPEYLTTKYAKKLSALSPQISDIGIQHHHAHIASCMADNDLENRKVIGVAFDGTGYGSDGTIWSAEFLVSDYTEFERAAHLKHIRLPGGDAAIREPWRIAVSLLYEAYGENFCGLELDFTKHLNKEKWLVLKGMLDKEINCPPASSMGRLFDGISALIGLKKEITYEGEAAIELEMAIEPVQNSESRVQSYKYGIEKIGHTYIIDFIPIVKGVVEDLQTDIPVSVISEKFHNTIAEMTVETCVKIRSDAHNKLNEVALSGGVFQNMFLLDKTYKNLIKDGFKVYIHRHVPPNDGGISLGQAVIASNKIKNR
ncbi:carbamoyltransferase HypF, partial [candidate division WOR-3 bacterium]|nr:carbamoyltransferase HypF [candidate division WOR-3 bacterium]